MKIAVLSDIHSNQGALEAVLNDAGSQDVEQYWCLGDAVGYGPTPHVPLLWIKYWVSPDYWVMGNHDAMLADYCMSAEEGGSVVTGDDGLTFYAKGQLLSLDDWRFTVAEAIQGVVLSRTALLSEPEADAFWRENFTKERVLPRTHAIDGVEYTLVHASRTDPTSRYIFAFQKEIILPKELTLLKEAAARSGLPQVQFFGHTHVPTLIRADDASSACIRAEAVRPEVIYQLDSSFALVNPGSVGQPRDLCQWASYLILDTAARSIVFKRVKYDWRETARSLRSGNFPESLVRRLTSAGAYKETPGEWIDHYRTVKENIENG